MSVNKSIASRYNEALYRRPLIVKSLTGATLSSLSELISQCSASAVSGTSNDEDKVRDQNAAQKLGRLLSQLKLSKILIMFCYGGFVSAPINHFMYGWITKATNKRVMTNRIKRLVQLFASLSLVSPLQVFFLVSTLTIVNANVNGSVREVLGKIKLSLRSKYFKILTSSWISTSVLVSFAQNFVEPEKWSIFFSFAYAVLGTGQNIYLKLREGNQRSK